MRREPPFDFAWCQSHDETFPLGAICSELRAELQREATSARARGDFAAERKALDHIHLDDRASSGVSR